MKNQGLLITHDMLLEKLTTIVKKQILNEETIFIDEPLSSYGISSIMALSIAGEIEEALKVEIDPLLFWEYPTINKMATYLTKVLNNQNTATEVKNSL